MVCHPGHLAVTWFGGQVSRPDSQRFFSVAIAGARVHFLCSPKENEPKERAPPSPAFFHGCGAPWSVGLYAHPCADKPQSSICARFPDSPPRGRGAGEGGDEPYGSSGCARHCRKNGMGISAGLYWKDHPCRPGQCPLTLQISAPVPERLRACPATLRQWR